MNWKSAAALAKQAFQENESIREMMEQIPEGFFCSLSAGPLIPTDIMRVELIYKGKIDIRPDQICADVDKPRITRMVAFCDVDKRTGKCQTYLGPEAIGGPIVDLEHAYRQHYEQLKSSGLA